MFLIGSYIKNIGKYKLQFSDPIYTNVLNFFMWITGPNTKLKYGEKNLSLTNYCSLDNDDPISFFMILLRTQIFVFIDFSSSLSNSKNTFV